MGHLLISCSDVMGSVAFTPVKNDMLGNVKVCPPLFQVPNLIYTPPRTENP